MNGMLGVGGGVYPAHRACRGQAKKLGEREMRFAAEQREEKRAILPPKAGRRPSPPPGPVLLSPQFIHCSSLGFLIVLCDIYV